MLRDATVVQALLWAGFNAFWANLATLLADGPQHLGSAWAGAFGVVGAAGALAASISGRQADRIGPARVAGYSVGLVIVGHILLFAPPTSLTVLVLGVIVLDFGVQSGLVANQTRAFAIDPKAQGRINTIYMTGTFVGALGAAASGWLMSRYGWAGVATLGVGAGLLAAIVHYRGQHSRA